MIVPSRTVAHYLNANHYLGATGRGFAWSDEYGVLVLAKPTSRRLPQDGTWLELVRCEPRNAWGAYEPAIRRWEATLGTRAPRPTDTRGRLMPEFVEWMMGLPQGWTDGSARTHRLRMLGNAVVPMQAAHAIRLLAGNAP